MSLEQFLVLQLIMRAAKNNRDQKTDQGQMTGMKTAPPPRQCTVPDNEYGKRKPQRFVQLAQKLQEVKKGLDGVELLVITDPFMNDAAVLTDRKDNLFVLPIATQFETSGSVTATGRNVRAQAHASHFARL